MTKPSLLEKSSKPYLQEASITSSVSRRDQFSILSGPDFIGGFVAPGYVVEGIIQRGSLYSLTAKTGHGKTSICVKLVFCFGNGKAFAGHEVEKGNICFLVGENPDDVRARFLVAAEAYGFEPLDFELVTKTSDEVKDKKGRLIPSVVAMPISEDKAMEMSREARSDEDAILDMLLNWPNGSYAFWCDKLGWLSKEKRTPQKSRVNRAMDSLKSDKLVKMYRKKCKLTDAGRKEAGKAL